MIYFFLTLSVIINLLLLWYIKGILTKLLFISENSDDLLNILDNFSNHLNAIYELETFYGEPVLEHLVQHSRQIVEEIKNYGEMYILTDDETDHLIEEDEDEEEG